MFEPGYRITPFLISCLEEIAARNVPIKQEGKGSPLIVKVARDSFNRNVYSSTRIEGNLLSLAQVAALSERKDVEAQEFQKMEVKNCITALNWILKNKNFAMTQPRILKLHALMTQGILPKNRCGQYRDVQNYIANAKGQVIFTPIAPAQVASRMRGLCQWLKESPQEHPIIRSAVFHHRFVAIHPFTDGNGRVARAASQAILFYHGFDPIWTLGLDEFFARGRAKYYDMIQQTHDLDGDYTHWIEYVAQGLCEAVESAAKRMTEEGLRQKQSHSTPKQEELLKLLKRNGISGSAQLCLQMKVNRARINQLISPLVKKGIVVKEGETRGVKYRLA